MDMIFMMGLPAAGKSTIAARDYADFQRLDPDMIKAEHPQYDPARACDVHEWSMEEMERRFLRILSDGPTQPWLIDGTGTNAESMVRRMTQAKAAGFRVILVYVQCSLATSLQRAAARTRQVPEAVIHEKARNIATSFQLVAPHADEVRTLVNDR